MPAQKIIVRPENHRNLFNQYFYPSKNMFIE